MCVIYVTHHLYYLIGFLSDRGDVKLDYSIIGKNIRKIRTEKKMRQEDLAEKTNLSPNYIGAVERNERIPSIETFISIINALDVSADVIFQELLSNGYSVKSSLYIDRITSLPAEEQKGIYEILDILIEQSKQRKFAHK